MDSPDQSFLAEFKPLHVPHKYEAGASTQNNVIFALAQLKEGTADDVGAKLSEYEPEVSALTHQTNASEVLNYLFDKGLIKATRCDGELCFNLSKIEVPNSGKADSLY